MFLHTWHPQPYLLSFGNYHLRWYGLCLALAALAGMGIAQHLAKKYRLNVNRVFDLALILLITGFIGARLYHVLNEWPYYRLHLNEIWKVWNGGLAIHGGLFVGLIMLIIFARRWKWDPWLLADILAPALVVGQAIGRWGNYFNQELFGRPTGQPWGIPIYLFNRPPPYITDNYFHPTFLYESLGCLAIAVILYWCHRRRWKKSGESIVRFPGSIALLYFFLYALLRLGVESLRIDQTPIIGAVRLPILVSGGIAFVSALTFIIRYRRTHARP